MADLRPFRALRPPAEFTDRVSAPPYDVIDTEEARALAAQDPFSFLRVTRPEIDFSAGETPDGSDIHARGRQALAELVGAGALVLDDAPAYAIYRQQRDTHIQVGLVALAGVQDYLDGLIKTHEHTRPDKENDRTEHILALSAHDEPVLLMTGFDDPVWELLHPLWERAMRRPVTTTNTDPDGVVHDLWRLDDAEEVSFIAACLADVEELFVADGHHRSAAAARAAKELPGVEGADAMPIVVFPAEQLVILPYHRLVADLNGWDLDSWLAELSAVMTVEVLGPAGHPGVAPEVPGQWGMYTGGTWYRLTLKPEALSTTVTADLVGGTDPVAALDVSLLQELVLAPLLRITDPRTDPRIAFVGGARGTAALERQVDAGRAEVAFAMYPTTVEQLIAVSDTGRVMPPKSTWFEPKLRSGLFVHPFG